MSEDPQRDYELISRRENQQARECSICGALLNYLAVEFKFSDFSFPSSDPPDAIFQSAAFEVTESYDEGRRIQGEYKDRAKGASIKKSGKTWMPDQMPWSEVVPILIEAASRKNYSPAERRKLDLVIYLNREEDRPDYNSTLPDLTELEDQGWRSVSAVHNVGAMVLLSNNDAPGFLRRAVGRPIHYNSLITREAPIDDPFQLDEWAQHLR